MKRREKSQGSQRFKGSGRRMLSVLLALALVVTGLLPTAALAGGGTAEYNVGDAEALEAALGSVGGTGGTVTLTNNITGGANGDNFENGFYITINPGKTVVLDGGGHTLAARNVPDPGASQNSMALCVDGQGGTLILKDITLQGGEIDAGLSVGLYCDGAGGTIYTWGTARARGGDASEEAEEGTRSMGVAIRGAWTVNLTSAEGGAADESEGVWSVGDSSNGGSTILNIGAVDGRNGSDMTFGIFVDNDTESINYINVETVTAGADAGAYVYGVSLPDGALSHRVNAGTVSAPNGLSLELSGSGHIVNAGEIIGDPLNLDGSVINTTPDTAAVRLHEGAGNSCVLSELTIAAVGDTDVGALPAVLSPDGEFLDWYTDEACTTLFTGGSVLNRAITDLYARGSSGAQQLAAPGIPDWDEEIPGKAVWTAVANADSYIVQLYKDDAPEGDPVPVPTPYYDFTSVITEAGEYNFFVKAVGDGYQDSTEAEALKTYHYSAFEGNFTFNSVVPFTINSIIGGMAGYYGILVEGDVFTPQLTFITSSFDLNDAAFADMAEDIVSYAHTVPQDGTLDTLTAQFKLAQPVNLDGQSADVHAIVYVDDDDDDNVYEPLGSAVTLSPQLSGLVASGQITNITSAPLDLEVTEGSKLLLVLYCTSPSGTMVSLSGTATAEITFTAGSAPGGGEENTAPTLAKTSLQGNIESKPVNDPASQAQPLSSLLNLFDAQDGEQEREELGIAVVGIEESNSADATGEWQYNINNTLWVKMENISPGNALLLPYNSSIRFWPDEDTYKPTYQEFDITFRLWDGTTGTAGGRADVTVNGDATAFSGDTAVATSLISNPIPTFANGTIQIDTLPVGATNPDAVSVSTMLNRAEANALSQGIAITTVDNTNGTWQYKTGGAWIDIDTTQLTSGKALMLLNTAAVRFVPNSSWSGNATLEFRTWSGVPGTSSGTYLNTGGYPVSSAKVTGTVTVEAVNTRPSASNPLAFLENKVVGIDGNGVLMVGLLAALDAHDAEQQQADLGIAIVAATTETAGGQTGKWQYSTGAGWADLEPVSPESALLLDGDSRIRFIPDVETFPASGMIPVPIQVLIWDKTTGSAAAYADTTAAGLTAFSSAPISVRSFLYGVPTVEETELEVDVPAEKAGDPDPISVADLLSAAGSSGAAGIAVTAAENTHGTWQYKTSGVWTDFPNAFYTGGTAFMLSDQDDVRFVPEPGWNGEATIQFRGWGGNSSGLVGTLADLDELLAGLDDPVNMTERIGLAEVTGTVTINLPQEPEDTPEAAVDYTGQKLTGLVPGAVYRIEGTEKTADGAGGIAIEESWIGTEISIVKKGNGTATGDSEAQELELPARLTAPTGVGATHETGLDTDDGALTGVSTAMQYRTEEGEWTDVTGTTVTSLAPGTYFVRTKATASAFASEEAEKTIYPAESVTLDANGGTINSGNVTAHPYGAAVTLPTDVTLPNAAFAGWYTDSGFTGAPVTQIGATETGPRTYYAKWTNVITYSLNYPGGGTYATAAALHNGTMTAPQAAPVRSGYTFTGWYKDALCLDPWSFTEDTATKDTTLYAGWAASVHSVTGTVADETPAPVSGASVTLMKGNTQVKSAITDGSGQFILTEVPDGGYNLVVSDGGRIVTTYVTVRNGILSPNHITLPGKKFSQLTVRGNDTPSVVADGLNDQFTPADQTAIDGGDTVRITLEVEKVTPAAPTASAIQNAAGSRSIDLYLDMTVYRQLNSDPVTPLPTVQSLLKIMVPYDLTGKSNVAVYRYHGSQATALTQITSESNAADGTYLLDRANHQILIWARNFSTYAVAYTTGGTETGGDDRDGDSSSGGSSMPSRTITVTETGSSLFKDSTASIKVEANMNKAFTNSVEVKVTDTDESADSFGLGAAAEIYPFDISFYIKGTNTKTRPAEGYAVTITLPVPENLLGKQEQLAIAQKGDKDGSALLKSRLTQIRGVWYLVFEADGSSPYALVVKHASQGNTPAVSDTPQRIYGQNRYDTAVAIAKAYFPEGTETVILARGDVAVDALPAVPLAQKYNAPLLLTPPDSLPDQVMAEIKALGAKKVIIIGGPGAVKPAVEDKLKEGLGSTAEIERIYGPTHYETAYEIAKRVGGDSGQAVLVNGDNYQATYPDVLSISSWAAHHGVPILYGNSRLNLLPEATAQALAELKVTGTLLIGGTGVLPEALEDLVPGAVRYGGMTRYDTNVEVLKKLQPNPQMIYVVTGKDFADALPGAAAAAQSNGWLVLTGAPGTLSGLTPGQESLLQGAEGEVSGLHVFGGPAVVPEASLERVKELLGLQ